MQKFSRKYSNREYAPGLALYGVDGKDGVSGESGRSLFVCQYNIDDNEGASQFGNAINQSLDMTSNDNSSIGRPYMNGDVFLCSTGYLYRIDDYDAISTLGSQLTATKFQGYMSVVGVINISETSDIFSENTKRLVLDTEHYKCFIINMSSVSEADLGSIDSPLTVISDNTTSDNRIYFMGLKSIYAGSSDARLSIYYDIDNNAYVIDSDKDILIDADVRISESDDDNVYDEFSKPILVGSSNSMTSFSGLCSYLSWNVSSSLINIYDDEVIHTNEIVYNDDYTLDKTKLSKQNNPGNETADGDDNWVIPSKGLINDYSIHQFELTKSDNSLKTDYVKICAVRTYEGLYDSSFYKYCNQTNDLKFDFAYCFTKGKASYNLKPASGFVEVRFNPSTNIPVKMGEEWWDEIGKQKLPNPSDTMLWGA